MLRTATLSGLFAVLSVTGPFAAKETIHIQVGKENTPFDTVAIWIDYAVPPEVPPQTGTWAEYEKDTSWMEGDVRHVRYNHVFLAQKGSKKGLGGDYIHYISDAGGEPQYSANCGFTFKSGDTTESWNWDPMHCNEYPDLGGLKGGLSFGLYGEMKIHLKGQTDHLNPGTWIRFLSRENGWVGFTATSVAAAPLNKEPNRAGWLVHLAPGTVLRAPPGAKALRVFDVQGKVHWETRNLAAGAPVALPEALPQGTLRYHWL